MDTGDGASDASTVTVSDLQKVLQTRYNDWSNIERAIVRSLVERVFLVVDYETYGRGPWTRGYGFTEPDWLMGTSASSASITIRDPTASFCPGAILLWDTTKRERTSRAACRSTSGRPQSPRSFSYGSGKPRCRR